MRARWLARLLRGPLLRLAGRRAPDFVIGGAENPYLLRWYLIPRNRLFNVYLHRFVRSDDDRALHDHPWPSLGLILTGRYAEITPARGVGAQHAAVFGLHDRRIHVAGTIRFRLPRAVHRVELLGAERRGDTGAAVTPARPVWTLFLTGPRVRPWGFWCPHGWRHWQDFTGGPRGETVGRGCD